MKHMAGFWFGMGAGVMAGTTLGILLPVNQPCAKSRMAKRVRKMGIALDRAADSFLSSLR